MDERLQEALDEIAALVQQSQMLSPREQDELAKRIETMASTLRWEMLFHLPAAGPAPALNTAAVPRKLEDSQASAM
jgi:hypothetical protein